LLGTGQEFRSGEPGHALRGPEDTEGRTSIDRVDVIHGKRQLGTKTSLELRSEMAARRKTNHADARA
jgi:hypothetical protein